MKRRRESAPRGRGCPEAAPPRGVGFGACCWASWKWSERTASRFVSPPPFCSGDEQEITSKRPQASPGSAARSFPGAALRPAEGHGPRATKHYGQDAPLRPWARRCLARTVAQRGGRPPGRSREPSPARRPRYSLAKSAWDSSPQATLWPETRPARAVGPAERPAVLICVPGSRWPGLGVGSAV